MPAREFAKVAPQFWNGETGRLIRELGRDCQVLALYTVTCPGASAIGIYYLPIPIVSHETGISPQEALKGLQRLSEVGFCAYDAPSEWVFIRNMAKFQIGQELKAADNRHKWLCRELESVRKSPFFNDFLTMYRDCFHLNELSLSEGGSEPHRSKETETETETETEKKRARARARSADDLRIRTNAIDIWFDQEFLPQYPEDHHDQLKTARAFLRKHKPDAAERARILATLELWKASPEWLKDGGKWIKGVGNFFSDGLHQRKPAGIEAGPHYETATQIAARENGAAPAPSDPQAAARFHKILDGVMQ
jgi:hypothetical protein